MTHLSINPVTQTKNKFKLIKKTFEKTAYIEHMQQWTISVQLFTVWVEADDADMQHLWAKDSRHRYFSFMNNLLLFFIYLKLISTAAADQCMNST